MRALQRRAGFARAAVVTLVAGGLALAGATAASAASGTVNTAGTALTVRSGPGTGYTSVGTVADGAAVTISCQTAGTSVTGTYGTTTIWDKIGDGRFVSDAYVFTGSDGRVAPDCTGTGTVAAKVTATIDAAKSMTGKYPYSWGGGNYAGPTKGICCSPSGIDDRNTVGFDCSGLMEYAFYQGAGLRISSTSSQQYAEGYKVALANRKAGDMLFWSDATKSPSAIHHVALYLGNDQIVEADRVDGPDIRVRSISLSETGLMGNVVRPIR
jgi:cell wall-associated NlpC family hydrolase